MLILKFLTFFDVLNYSFQRLLSLYFWNRHEMLLAYFNSHCGLAAPDWQKGVKSHRMPMRSYLGNHGYLLAPALQDQAGAADHPCRVRRLSLVLRKTSRRYRISPQIAEDTTCLEQVRLRRNLHLIQTVCLDILRVHHLGSHRNTKYLKPIFELALQYSPPLSSTPLLPTLIRLSANH